ncbi:MAG: hypothetical protein D6690_03060 [Nitrospirae bacterium]|nr:MAG: hypothetical protein D6690_03060 [Nitrospirota bacterium]
MQFSFVDPFVLHSRPYTIGVRAAWGLVLCLSMVGCAAWLDFDPSRTLLVACPPDTIWEQALTVFDGYPLASVDRDAGVIETDWREEPAQGQPYGLFGREGLGDKERSRLTFRLEPSSPHAFRIELAEQRQHWGFRGGARIYDWYPVPPSPDVTERLVSTLKRKLKEKGCVFDVASS